MKINNFCNENCSGINGRCNCGCGCGCTGHPCPRMPQAYDDVGPTGPQGPVGPQGPTGPQGPIGPQGPVGLQGVAGATGPMGPQGMAGVPGAAGPKGDTGAAGQTGAAGKTATVRVEAATSVPFDDAPRVINVGTPQAAVLRFAIPAGKPGADGEQGPKGDTGSTGPTGPKGATGPAGIKTFGQLNSIVANADLEKDKQTQIPLAYGGEFNNVALAQNTITIKETGYYSLFYAMHPFVALTEDYADVTFSMRNGGKDIPWTGRTIRTTRGTHDLSFYGNAIVELEAGAVIDAAFKCNEDAKFFFSVDNISSLIVYKLA